MQGNEEAAFFRCFSQCVLCESAQLMDRFGLPEPHIPELPGSLIPASDLRLGHSRLCTPIGRGLDARLRGHNAKGKRLTSLSFDNDFEDF